MCANEARKAVDEWYPPSKEDLAHEFTSHYDTESRICYVLTHIVRDGGLSVSYTVFDAIEGRGYASYIWINPEKKQFWEVTPSECEIYPHGGKTISCKDSDEFASLVDTLTNTLELPSRFSSFHSEMRSLDSKNSLTDIESLMSNFRTG